MTDNKKYRNNDIDESLYSRQLYVLGHDAMQRMSKSNILIIGLGGLGTEIAKNVILSGVNSVTLYDNKDITIEDLSTCYYFTENDIGKSRVDVAKKKLAELNPYVKVSIIKKDIADLTSQKLSDFTVMVTTEQLLNDQVKLNNMARDANVYFISSFTFGLFGQIFSDFGDEFLVIDVDGEKPKTSIIENIIVNDDGYHILCIDKEPHNLENGDLVTFSEVQGLTELNDCSPCPVKILNRFSFQIIGESSKNKYVKGGIFTQVKQNKIINFKSLSDSIKDPSFMMTDLAHFERPNTLHIGFQALNKFFDEHNRLPNAYDSQDSEKFTMIAHEFCTTGDLSELEKEILQLMSYIAKGQLQPIQSVIGGIASQEILKACSCKFTPIYQWLYFDSVDCLQSKDTLKNLIDNNESIDAKSRYIGQMNVFGKEFQQKLSEQKYFVVGSGAIGCELLKNFAMIGLGATCDLGANSGSITITDMDTIERSNLNRQFLFRSTDIGKCKSIAAASAIKEINPNINIIAHENRVGIETEDIYDEKFFANLDGVANALDNVQARLYVDSRCVFFSKPLLESGTLGTKGSVQVIIPHLTESYGSSPDPPEKSIPICTLKTFPYLIDHTIQYARDQFEGLFTNGPQNVNKYFQDIDFLNNLSYGERTEVLKDTKKILTKMNVTTFEECVRVGYDLWHEIYRNNIQQLLYNFPEDSKTESGADFWSGSKRVPHALKFDRNNEMHVEFIHSFANLWTRVFRIMTTKKVKTIKNIKKILSTYIPIPFTPKNGVKIKVVNDDNDDNDDQDQSYEELLEELNTSDYKITSLVPIDFEKDDNTNFHMDFITSASNLRAMNYDIKTVTKHKTKGIAGKIIPAIATTTSIVAGLVTLELYKLVQGHDNIEKFRNTYSNWGLPFCTFSEPIEAKKQKYKNLEFSLWDYIDVNKNQEIQNVDLTLQEFLDHFEEKYEFDICMVNYGSLMIFSFFAPPKKTAKKLNMTIKEIIEDMTGKKINSKVIMLGICVDDDDDDDNDDIDVPPVRYHFV